jgi:polyhydroxyalkanoate synthesis repressor PhaR
LADDVATMPMPRTIKRYRNRKLYDTHDSHYVTLEKVAELVRGGEELRVVENGSQRDITAATMAQIIFEEEKRVPRLPIQALCRIIRSGLPS